MSTPNSPANAREVEALLFKPGDLIEILPDFQDQGDDALLWTVVSEVSKGRLDISPIDTGLSVPPIYTVQVAWVRHRAASVTQSPSST